MVATWKIAILLAISLAVCAIGFKKFIWFMSIGYGFAVAAASIGIMALYSGDMPSLTWIYCGVMLCYGLRLGGYLAYREIKTTYNTRLKGDIIDGRTKPTGVKIAVWISCALLYILMLSPIIYRCENAAGTNGCEIAGLIVSVSGLLMEAIADAQKDRVKKSNPNKLCTTGLYKFVRCPNYLGELLVWTGVFVSAFGALSGAGQWIASSVGYVCIIYIMFSGVRRLEIRQDRNYCSNPEYQQYRNSTPVMLPFIPLYSVKKYKWLVA